MDNDIQDKIRNFVYPTLIAVVGFIMAQIYFDIKDVKNKVNTFNSSINQNTQQIKWNDARIKFLEDKGVTKKIWEREWVERWQSALDWADNERKK